MAKFFVLDLGNVHSVSVATSIIYWYIDSVMDSQFYRKAKSDFKAGNKIIALAKNKRFMVRFVVAAVIALYVLLGSHGVIQRVRLTMQKNDLQAKIAEAEKESQWLQAQSRALDGDAKAIEKVAREKHGMIREGETVYRVNKK